jgi:hypothetical protein
MTNNEDENCTSADCSDHINARARDLAILKNGKDNFRAYIMILIAAIGLIACPIALVAIIGSGETVMSGEVLIIISTVGGTFASCLKDAYKFEFGSSRGSREKDDRNVFMIKQTSDKKIDRLK